MLGRFRQLLNPKPTEGSNRFPPGTPASGGFTFSCPITNPPPGIDSFTIYSLNLAFALQLMEPLMILAVETQVKAMEAAIKTLETNETFIRNAIEKLEGVIAVEKTHAWEKAAAGSIEKETLGAAINEGRVDVQQKNAELLGFRATREELKRQLSELREREAAELYHNFDPLTVQARLVRGQGKEVVWIGQLDLRKIYLGRFTNKISEIEERPAHFLKYRVAGYGNGEKEPGMTLLHESHIPIPPITITEREPLELQVIVTGPEPYELENAKEEPTGWSGGVLRPNALSFQNIVAPYCQILSSELSFNYDHEP